MEYSGYGQIKLDFETLESGVNLAEQLTDEQLKYVGETVLNWYTTDKESRSEWESKSEGALKLALQIMEPKTYPWPNASNVKFPLLTVAALQFSARVYPALIKAPDLAKFRIMGRDPNGKKAARAMRIGKFISYQLLEENEEWEEEQDKLFIALPILGCVFKKTYYDHLNSRMQSKLVLPSDLILHYYTKDMERSRATEYFELYTREIRERQLRGLYLDSDITDFSQPGSQPDQKFTDERQGITVPSSDTDTPRAILECHCFWDFDGDGYEEPYIVTVDKESGIPLRIVSRFKEIISQQSLEIENLQKQSYLIMQAVPTPEQIAQSSQEDQLKAQDQLMRAQEAIRRNEQRIEELGAETPNVIRIIPWTYYTKYSFIPAPDGGFYDLGFGSLLGPLNESVNTLINQLLDSGTMQNGNNGFIAQGARIKGGQVRMKPFEWQRVATGGASLKDSIVPLPINEPSGVLFNMLGLLINYSERVSSITDVMQGDNPGQNTPAFNMQALLEQGMQVFNGVFKRIYRSFRGELRRVYKLNEQFLDPEHYVSTMDGELRVLQQDFSGDPKDLLPAADPNAFSNMEQVMKAQFLATRSASVPGYNTVVLEKRLLEAMDVQDVDEIFPVTPDGQLVIQPPPNPELEIEKADMQRRTLEGRMRGQADLARAEAEVNLKQAQTVKTMAEAGAIDKELAIQKLQILEEQRQSRHEEIMSEYDRMLKEFDIMLKQYDLQIADKKVEAAEAQATKAAQTPKNAQK